MASKEETKKEEKSVFVPKSTAELQRIRLNKLMANPAKPVVIPDRPEEKQPRVFNPPEFVRNIWGSSAGAGSGDFHVYRGVRRREYARQKFLDQEQKKNELDAAHQAKVEINRKVAEERTAKKRAKRQKKKLKQKIKKFKMSQSKQQEKKKESSEEEDSDQNDDVDLQERNGTISKDDKKGHQASDSENANQTSNNSRNNVDDNSEESEDEEDLQREREKERRAMLASQPEDVDDNSCSDEETES